MYIDAPMIAYSRYYIKDSDFILFRDGKTRSIFHKFLLPPKIDNSKLQRNLHSYVSEIESKKLENCKEIYNICHQIPCEGKYYELGRSTDIEASIVIIPTCEDFITQSKNTVGFVKIMLCLGVFITVLKILISTAHRPSF